MANIIRVGGGGSAKAASGSYTSSTSAQSVITVGFKPKYLCIVGSASTGNMIIYDERIDTEHFKYAGSSTSVSVRELEKNTNYNLYSIDDTGFTVNKTSVVYTYYWFAIG